MSACLIALTILLPTASAATAPARIAYSVSSQVPHSGDAGGAVGGVALPGGSVVTFAYDSSTRATLALKLQANGALDPQFGSGGIARLTTPGQTLRVDGVQRLADGRLLIAGMHQPTTDAPPRIVLARLLPGGALDPSFGDGGFAQTGMGSPAGPFGPPSIRGPGVAGMAVAPDGSIFVTGPILVAASMPSPTEPSSPRPPMTDWAVVKLGPDGVADPSFGVVKIPVGSGRMAAGTGIVLTPTGSIVVLGFVSQAPGSYRTSAVLAGLTPRGTPDPAFNGGLPAVVPFDGGQQLHRHVSGALDVIGGRSVVRFVANGTLDSSFASGGRFAFDDNELVTSFIATPDGGALIGAARRSDGPADPGRPPSDPNQRMVVRRMTAGGAFAESASLHTPFGGGIATPFKRKERSIDQNTFSGELLRRDDGSFLAIGRLSIHVPGGKMDGLGTAFVAAQAFTPSLTPDLSFGGPDQPPSLRVGLRRQRAVTVGKRDFIALRVTSSQAGLVSLRVRDRGNRLIASGTHPVWAAGTTIMRVRVTTTGRPLLLRARKGLRIAVRHDFRDILTAGATGVTQARLR